MPNHMMSVVKKKKVDCESTVNLLPCCIHHDGHIDQTLGFWIPTKPTDENQTTYFRGRKMTGKCIRLPKNYTGIVVQTENDDGQRDDGQRDDEQRDDGLEVRNVQDKNDEKGIQTGQNLHVTSTFDDILIWAHGSSSSNSSGQYEKNVEEWLYSFTLNRTRFQHTRRSRII
ncbi:hypothetical protein EsDP_00001817 [Epichloe bromicola]|uniref:Uncharacterized protein n=1 Tax=Epichloe bromicola TaxID=79588 RepID=A0ABQ0CJ00_9HYPO